MIITVETDFPNEQLLLIEKVYNEAAKYFSLPKKVEVILSSLSEQEIREVNLSARGKDEVTDVLSFPYLDGIKGKKLSLKEHKTDINPENGCLMLGEINICLSRAEEQAKEYGHSVPRETAYLALHGLLHLLGYDHIEETDKAEMRSKEEEILSRLILNRV